MKKRIWMILLCGLLLMNCCACGQKQAQQTGDEAEQSQNKENKTEQRKNVIEKDEKTGESYYLLGDFENYFECSQVKYSNSFGKVTQIKKSEKPDMVTYGEQSVKVDILGVEETWHKLDPCMEFSSSTGFFDLTSDFSNMSKFTFDIYNAQDYEVGIRVYQGSGGEMVFVNENHNLCLSTRFTLKPNQWNHVEMDASLFKGIQYDIQLQAFNSTGADALKSVNNFVIMFDRGELHESEQTYYVDNVRAYLKDNVE